MPDNIAELPMMNPNALTADDLALDETFDKVLLIKDEYQRQAVIARIDQLAKEAGIPASTIKARRKLARIRYDQLIRAEGDRMTLFRDCPYPALHCGQWVCDDQGERIQDLDGLGINKLDLWACKHPILPTMRLIDIDTQLERLQIAFCKDGRWRTLISDRADLADSKTIVKRCANWGVEVSSENAKAMVRYIADVVAANPEMLPAKRSTERLGWIDDEFLPYTDGVQYAGDENYQPIYDAVKQEGNPGEWLTAMKAVRRNTVARIVMAASAASPLLEILNALPFVLHLWGGTGSGKTVAAMCAMSIWGNPQRGKLQWSLNSTATFIGKSAAFLRNIPFYGDELQAVDTRKLSLDKMIMTLCEGIDRGRGRSDGGVQQVSQWHCAFIFTGEEAIANGSSGGGVKNRLIEIRCEDGQKLIEDGNAVVSTITENYGYLGKALIGKIKEVGAKALRERYGELQREILRRKRTTDKQAAAIAAMKMGDDLLREIAFPAEAELDLDDLLIYAQDRDEVDVATRAYDWVQSWITTNPVRWLSQPDNNGERWGRLEKDAALIDRHILERELTGAGYPYSSCIASWSSRGWIEKTPQGRSQVKASVGGNRGYYIKLKLKVMEEDPPQPEPPF